MIRSLIDTRYRLFALIFIAIKYKSNHILANFVLIAIIPSISCDNNNQKTIQIVTAVPRVYCHPELRSPLGSGGPGRRGREDREKPWSCPSWSAPVPGCHPAESGGKSPSFFHPCVEPQHSEGGRTPR